MIKKIVLPVCMIFFAVALVGCKEKKETPEPIAVLTEEKPLFLNCHWPSGLCTKQLEITN